MLSIIAALSFYAAPFSATYAFGQVPQMTGFAISPNGEMIAMGYYDDAYGIRVYDLETSEVIDSWEVAGHLAISSFFWKRNDLLIFSVKSYESAIAVQFGMSGLLAKKLGEEEIIQLYDGDHRKVVDQDNILAILPDDPNHILVMYITDFRKGHGVYRINVDNPSQHETVIRPEPRVVGYVADRTGQVRGRIHVQNDGDLSWTLKKPERGWRNVTRRLNNEEVFFDVYGFPDDLRYAYVGSNHETDTIALYLYDIETGKFGEQLFHDPMSDLYDIVQRRSDGVVVGAKYADSRVRIQWLEAVEEERRDRRLRENFGAEYVEMLAITPDETTAAYAVETGSRPERLVVFDFEENHFYELPSLYPELDDVELATVVSTTYKARDGLDIPAFVTLPPGINRLDEARGLPFVVLPHGGPNARDFASFDWLPQFIAFRGYGVLQMNFRGSRGYGQEFMEQGDREWGQAMQDDITDGTKWLIAEGYADPDLIAIGGMSYGGYAALMGAAKEPDLYRCTTSINGVTDLVELLKDASPALRRATRSMIGRLWGDRKMLRDNSPTQRAADISVPVLLVQSQRDRRVPRRQAHLMRDALNEAGGDVTYVELKNGNHHLTVGNNRIIMLRALEDFLYDCLDTYDSQ
ncbi:MAG: prolyl oligopeptidase family serine peptidase [Pseudomonadota bacterium]